MTYNQRSPTRSDRSKRSLPNLCRWYSRLGRWAHGLYYFVWYVSTPGIILEPNIDLVCTSHKWTAIPHNTPKLIDSHIAPFVLLLAAFEALLVQYWIGLKLSQVLVYGGILGIVTAAAGKRALAATGKRRLQATS